MGSTRIKGTGLSLKLGPTTPVDFWADMMELLIEPTDAEQNTVTFEDAKNGNTSDYLMKGKAIQSTADDSFWRYVWDHSGATVPYTYAPHGNLTPTPAQPHFVGEVTIGAAPAIGGEAGIDSTYEFEIEWKCTGKPTLTTGA